MSDADVRAEVALVQAARWEAGAPEDHLHKRRREFLVQLGFVPAATDVEDLGYTTVAQWERLFTELRPDSQVSYLFYRIDQRAACGTIAVVRDGVIKTAFFVIDLDAWVRRNPQAIEVTTRAAKS